jgi:hypothetical protein
VRTRVIEGHRPPAVLQGLGESALDEPRRPDGVEEPEARRQRTAHDRRRWRRLPYNAGKAEGVSVGNTAAAAVLEARVTDGWNGTASYTPANLPGRWMPTPPALAPALMPHWGRRKPFALDRADRFRRAPAGARQRGVRARPARGAGDGRRLEREADGGDHERGAVLDHLGHAGWNPVARQASAPKWLTLAQNARRGCSRC